MRAYLLHEEGCLSLCPELIRALRAHGIEGVCSSAKPKLGNERSATAIVALDPKSLETVVSVRGEHPKIVAAAIVKDETGTPCALIDRAYGVLLSRHLALIGAYCEDRFAVLTGERGVFSACTARKFTNDFALVLASRTGQAHYHTLLETAQTLPISAAVLDETLSALRDAYHFALFPRYDASGEQYPRAEFGFLARRTPAGTLITTRASNKESPSIDDLAVISTINRYGEIRAVSRGRKPSLNGPLAHEILALRPEINWVLHTHVFLPTGRWTKLVTAPGTLEDFDAVLELIKAGERIINQPLHGALLLLRDLSELLPLLQAQGLYAQRSELYEIAYARFQDREGQVSPFTRAITSLGLAADAAVLDLCCGTGASTRGLKRQFNRVDFADGSASMLSIAERELAMPGILLQLPDLRPLKGRRYDLVTLRQAFNYLSPHELAPFFSGILGHLNPGGWLAFNTFEPHTDGVLPVRHSEVQGQMFFARTEEHNRIRGNHVVHAQRTELVDFAQGRWEAFLDLNTFYQHPIEQIEEVLSSLGYRVRTERCGRSITVLAQHAVA